MQMGRRPSSLSPTSLHSPSFVGVRLSTVAINAFTLFYSSSPPASVHSSLFGRASERTPAASAPSAPSHRPDWRLNGSPLRSAPCRAKCTDLDSGCVEMCVITARVPQSRLGRHPPV